MKVKITLFIAFITIFFTTLFMISRFANHETATLPPTINSVVIREVEIEKGTYFGETISTVFQGFGEFEFLSGEKYLGSWGSSRMDGDGVVIFPGVGRYIGELSNNTRSGQGKFEWDNGDVYAGTWINDSMNGTGVYYFSNGAVFTGTFDDNAVLDGCLVFEGDGLSTDNNSIQYLSIEVVGATLAETVEFMTSNGLEYTGDLPKLGKIVHERSHVFTGRFSIFTFIASILSLSFWLI